MTGVPDIVQQLELVRLAERGEWAFVASCVAVALVVAVSVALAAWVAVRAARLLRDDPRRHAVPLALGAAAALYAAEKPPSPVLKEGIRLTSCDVTSKRVDLAWEASDGRIVPGETVFVVQSASDGGAWTDVAQTTNTSIRIPGFTVDRTARWRIKVDVTPSAGAEGGAQ